MNCLMPDKLYTVFLKGKMEQYAGKKKKSHTLGESQQETNQAMLEHRMIQQEKALAAMPDLLG